MDKQNLAVQQGLEGQGKNYFFEYIKKYFNDTPKEEILKTLNNINSIVIDNNPPSFNKKEFEVFGIFGFLLGVDYTGQAYLQKNIIENVKKRFQEVNVTQEMLDIFNKICEQIDKHQKTDNTYLSNALSAVCKQAATAPENEIEPTIKTTDLLLYKNLRAKINRFLKSTIIPVGFSIGLNEITDNSLTWERLLKANSLLQEQSVFEGSAVKMIKDIYGDEMFKSLLTKATQIFNETKFAVLYEESIVSAVEVSGRLGLHFNSELFSNEEYEKFKNDYETYMKENVSDETIYKSKKYDEKTVEILMKEMPDKFIEDVLEELLKQEITEIPTDIKKAIDKLLDNNDYLQHIYQYIKANISHPNRCKESKFDVAQRKQIAEYLKEESKICGNKYKELVELNCSEIPADIRNQVVMLVEDTIISCYLENADQKQYLISQLLENQITTYNHLSQIMELIETCKISGKNSKSYVELYNYTVNNTKIAEVFNNVSEINNLQNKMSIYHEFSNWFNGTSSQEK